MVLDQAGTDDLGLVGRILAGGLRVTERTGHSPQGPLYEAEDPDGRRVVLLILPARASWQETAGVRFLRMASQIRHPNVAGVYALGNLEDGSTYVVLELLVGEPLPQFLSDRGLPIGESLALTVQIAAGTLDEPTGLVACNYDLRVISSDGWAVEDFGVNLCTSSHVMDFR